METVNTPAQTRTALWIVGTIFILHLLIAGRVPLGVDEAHYGLYALHPALSYFDHPPMVGWLQMLVSPLGYSEFSLRLIPSLLLALISLQLYFTTRLLFNSAHPCAPLVAVILFNMAPFIQLMGWGLVPDLPLMSLALATVHLGYLIDTQPKMKYWLLMGVVLGLAGLSKYTAVFLPIGLILFLTRRQGLRWLQAPEPWLAAALALVMITPVLVWNFDNDWVSFNYQTDRGLSVGHWRLDKAVVVQLAQAVLYSLILYVGAFAATFQVVRGRWPKASTPAASLTLFCSWPLLLVIAWTAGDGPVLPNWPAMAWTLLTPVISVWLCTSWPKAWVRRTSYASAGLSLGLIGFLFLFLGFQPLGSLPFMAKALRDINGWQLAAQRAATLKQQNFPEHADSVLLVDNWTKASRIGWYAFPAPVQVLTEKTTQFSLWYGKPDQYTKGVLIRDKESNQDTRVYSQAGLSCEKIDTINTGIGGVNINTFDFYLCEGTEKTND